ncbi:MAG: hypothetical protein HON76_09455 [Candidatus Scalindua sp.]|jgi:hypothetical protein|nr:hypothetical protein [Candidatus Scalindua sp.]MBT5304207.1 hypothetical protein [Candidatus Scalindua sp.]MBT6053197.1 hypothetical protein [Candidatus Scalindua sp.]MBT6230569.1 hypothetical protein [Candidatus Scalindua sp.]MBT6562740.1 hypothetical protein [Candidatus Scalindua sp.]
MESNLDDLDAMHLAIETKEKLAKQSWNILYWMKHKNHPITALMSKGLDGMEVVEVGAHRKGIVEELEKVHIYISQLEKMVDTIKRE